MTRTIIIVKVAVTVESSVKYTNAGVPQGSILGPLLFLIFINDFEFNVNADVFLFADDANISKPYVNPRDAAQCINSDLNALQKWVADWMINFNASKTKFINFSLKKKKSILLLSFNGIQLEQVDEHKHLGVIFYLRPQMDTTYWWTCQQGQPTTPACYAGEANFCRVLRKRRSIVVWSGQLLNTGQCSTIIVHCTVLIASKEYSVKLRSYVQVP